MNPRDHQENMVVSFLAHKTGITSPQAAIRALVENTLLESCGGNDPDLPTELVRISATLGVKPPIRSTHIEADAVLIPAADGFSIVLKAGKRVPIGRQRFSWAHELCHTYFYEARKGSWARAIPGGSRMEEDLCDLGARAMLLPTKPILRKLDSFGPMDSVASSVLEAADWAQVSPQVLIIRARQLGFWENVAFACYMRHLDNGEAILVPVWKQAAKSPHFEIPDDPVRPPSFLHHVFAAGGSRRATPRDSRSGERRIIREAKRYSESMLLAAYRRC